MTTQLQLQVLAKKLADAKAKHNQAILEEDRLTRLSNKLYNRSIELDNAATQESNKLKMIRNPTYEAMKYSLIQLNLQLMRSERHQVILEEEQVNNELAKQQALLSKTYDELNHAYHNLISAKVAHQAVKKLK
jgi:hypothetical protein